MSFLYNKNNVEIGDIYIFMAILDSLKDSGLSAKEAMAYLSALELGSASIQRIAKKAKLKRSTAYDVIETLIEKGLLFQTIQGKRRVFSAVDPDMVHDLLKMRVTRLKGLLPELRSLYNIHEAKPKIRFYEGLQGLQAVYQDTLESSGTILAYGSIGNMWQVMSKEFIKEYVQERVKRHIFEKAIVPSTSESQEYARKNKEELREFRFIPEARYPFTNEINIYNDKIAILSFPEKVGLIIQSKKIADTQRAIFELAWIGAAYV